MTERECVYCAVRTGSLYTTQVKFLHLRRRPLRFGAGHFRLTVEKIALCQLLLRVLQFPLSVSFHQFSIPIHQSTTNVLQCFSPSTSVSPVSIIPPMLHTLSFIRSFIYSFIYQWGCIIIFSQYLIFSCQYNSTNAPYSFIHLQPTLYNVFLPALQFPLSGYFQQCTIPIHSSTTHAL